MKKLSVLLLSTIMALSLLTSCSSDEDLDGGTWEYSSYSFDLKSNMPELDFGIKEIMRRVVIAEFVDNSLEFKDGKVYTNGKAIGTYNDKNIAFADERIEEVASYSVDGKKLKITIDVIDLVKDNFEMMGGLEIKKATIELYYKK